MKMILYLFASSPWSSPPGVFSGDDAVAAVVVILIAVFRITVPAMMPTVDDHR